MFLEATIGNIFLTSMTTMRHQISNHDIKSLIWAGSSGLVIYGNCSGLHLTVLSGGPWFIHKKWLLFNQNNKLLLPGPVLGITKGVSAHPGSSREEAHYCRSWKLKRLISNCDKDQRFLLSSKPEAPPKSIKQLREEWWTYCRSLLFSMTPHPYDECMKTLSQRNGSVLTYCVHQDSEQSFKLDGEDEG